MSEEPIIHFKLGEEYKYDADLELIAKDSFNKADNIEKVNDERKQATTDVIVKALSATSNNDEIIETIRKHSGLSDAVSNDTICEIIRKLK